MEVGGKGGDPLPARYSLIENGYTTTIKNQGADGDCWAFAITTAMESNLKKTKGVDVEFSPKQLDYLMTSGSPYYDLLNTKFGFERGVGDGGNFLSVTFALGSQYTPIKESTFFQKMKNNDASLADYSSWKEYNDVLTVNGIFGGDMSTYDTPMNMSTVMSNKSEYVVSEYESLSGDTDEIAKVKEAVYESGAVYVGTYSPETENCWDADSNTIIDRGKTICGAQHGHAMTIVGWDDNHAYTDPATGTTKTGAFLLQNSWGDSSLLNDYGISYEALVAGGYIDESRLTAEQIAYVKDYIENYDAKEYVWLGYDFNDNSYAGATIDFGVIKEMRENNYGKVYDLSNLSVGLGGDTTDAVEFMYNTGEDGEYIESIAIAHHLITFRYSGTYWVYVDKENNGEYEKVGEVPFAAGTQAQQMVLDLDEQMEVSGPFKVKIELRLGDGTVLEVPTDYADYFTAAVYMAEDVEIPNTGSDEGDDNKVDENEKGDVELKAPDTGLFGGENAGLKVAGATVMVLASAYLGMAAFKNRKHLFHKIDFDKK